MKNFKYLLNRFMNKTATRQEKVELFDTFGEDAVEHLSNQEKNNPETEVEKILTGNEFNKITARFPELADENIISIHRNRYAMWPKVAAAAVIVLAVATGLWVNRQGYFSAHTSQTRDAVKPAVYSGKQLVTLPDGSTALLNEDSKLEVAGAFGTSSREVTLIGEALFDVTHDATKKFIVHTGKVSTTVLGTSFNINAYPGESKIRVTVVRGLVQVGDDQRTYGKIRPNEQIEVDVQSNDFVKRNTNVEEEVEWQKNFLVLDNATYAQAAEKIEKRFNVKVIIANESLKGCTVTALFTGNESLQQIVKGISAVQQATATVKGDTVIIEGGIGCKPSN